MSEFKLEPINQPYLRLRIYMGKNGAYAVCKTKQYSAELVGLNGEVISLDHWMSEGYGSSERKYPERTLKRWQELTGYEIKELDQTEAQHG